MGWLVFWTWSGVKSSFVGGVGRSVGRAGGQLDVIHGASIIKIIEPRQIASKGDRATPPDTKRQVSPIDVLCRQVSSLVASCRSVSRQNLSFVGSCRLLSPTTF